MRNECRAVHVNLNILEIGEYHCICVIDYFALKKVQLFTSEMQPCRSYIEFITNCK